MVSLAVPVLVAAVLVFLVSSAIHMASPWHKGDYPRLANEDEVAAALRPLAIPPGDYFLPRPAARGDMSSPAFKEKMKAGPVMIFTVMPNGMVSMGRNMTQWFVYVLVISAIAAVVAFHAVGAGADFHRVFHFVGAVAWTGYAGALWPLSIWYRRAWSSTIKATVDGLIYAAITAGVCAWLWPH